MNWKLILKYLIECELFLGTLATIFCLVVFSFVASTVWFSILAGLCAMNALFIYDRYRQSIKKP